MPNGVCELNCDSNNLVLRRKAFSNLFPSGVGSGLPTEQNFKSTTTTAREGTPLAEGLPEEANAIGKSTETETRSPLTTVYACTVHFAPKCESTNQIRALGPTGARVYDRLLRVYKAGPAVAQSFGLGTARVR